MVHFLGAEVATCSENTGQTHQKTNPIKNRSVHRLNTTMAKRLVPGRACAFGHEAVLAGDYSFENVRKWMLEIEKFANDNVCKVLVGNKCDLVEKRKVSREEGEELAKQYGIPYLETSAKSNICVEDSFTTMARSIK